MHIVRARFSGSACQVDSRQSAKMRTQKRGQQMEFQYTFYKNFSLIIIFFEFILILWLTWIDFPGFCIQIFIKVRDNSNSNYINNFKLNPYFGAANRQKCKNIHIFK